MEIELITKSQAVLLSDMYRGIIEDAKCTFPTKARTFDRDLSRLQTVIDRNELWFFTIHLPAFSKHLLKCIENGQFLPYPGPHLRTKKGCVFPRLFSGLTEQLFYDNGFIREDADSTPLLFLQTLLACVKKLRMECDDKTVRRTVESFVEVEEDVRRPTLNWGSTVLTCNRRVNIVSDDIGATEFQAGSMHNELYACSARHLPYFRAIQSVSDRLFSSFGTPFTGDFSPRHGPGAIADRCDNASKYQFSNWPAKLEYCFPYAAFGFPNAKYWIQPTHVNDPASRFRDRLVNSRLLAVPKTQKGPRLIAAEPNSSMWIQQGILDFIVDRVERSPLRNCINFFDQKLSGDLALKSSLSKKHATIDLSDASDRLSCWLVERLFRSNYDLLQAFNAVRTDRVSIPDKMGKEFPREIILKKFSTQGSALTFPVQTVVYAAIVIGVLIEHSGKRVTKKTIEWASKEVRVFGDDIIVPNAILESVVECIEALGFKVNTTKTFTRGDFRESCGVDGYKGWDVTPAYVLEPYHKSKPSSISSLVECSNNFFKKGFWHAAEAIKSTIPEEIRKRIPVIKANHLDLLEGSGTRAFGFISFSGSSVGSNRSRFNRDLHREEVKVLVPSAKVQRTEIRGDFALHQYFTERPGPDTIWKPGEARRPQSTVRLRWVAAETLLVG